jgi:hypothetical protein
MKTISAADANRYFSSVLRDVATGEVVRLCLEVSLSLSSLPLKKKMRLNFARTRS